MHLYQEYILFFIYNLNQRDNGHKTAAMAPLLFFKKKSMTTLESSTSGYFE